MRFGLPLVLAGIALALGLAAAPVRANDKGCDRASFGGFSQTDKRDTRYWVLVSQAVGPLEFRKGSGGKVIVERGSWIDPYSGRRLENFPAKEIEIDHVIPVCWAWARGASRWSAEQKRAFYNDQRYLFAVEAGLNRQKGAMAPDQFVPMNRAFACSYIELFLEGVDFWGLRMSKGEALAIAEARALACSKLAPPQSRPPITRVSGAAPPKSH